jgi:uncharacterized membrane protein
VFARLLVTYDPVLLNKAFAWIFELSNNQTIFDQFGQPNSIIAIQVHLDHLRKKLLQNWKTSLLNLKISSTEISSVYAQIDRDMQNIITLAHSICEPLVSVTASNMTSEQMAQVEREKEQENEQELEVEIHAEIRSLSNCSCANHTRINFEILLKHERLLHSLGRDNSYNPSNIITLQSYVDGLGENKYRLTNEPFKYLISKDASQVLDCYGNYARVEYRKPIMTILHVKSRHDPLIECFVAIAPPQDVEDAMQYYDQNHQTFSAEIFTLNGALLYTNDNHQKETYVKPAVLRTDPTRKKAIALYALLEKQLPILRESDTLLKSNNKNLVKEMTQRNPAMGRQVEFLYSFLQNKATREDRTIATYVEHTWGQTEANSDSEEEVSRPVRSSASYM